MATRMVAMAEAADALGLHHLTEDSRTGSSAQDWGRCWLALLEAWKTSGEASWKLNEWLTRRQFQLLDKELK